MICDCGGGTVDINTYKITATTPKLEFDELVVGKGGKIGSTFIDRQFQHWMTCRFGTAYTDLPAKKIGPGSRFMKEFEAFKRDFGGGRNVEMKYEVPLVMRDADDSDYYDVEEAMVKFTKYVALRFQNQVETDKNQRRDGELLCACHRQDTGSSEDSSPEGQLCHATRREIAGLCCSILLLLIETLTSSDDHTRWWLWRFAISQRSVKSLVQEEWRPNHALSSSPVGFLLLYSCGIILLTVFLV